MVDYYDPKLYIRYDPTVGPTRRIEILRSYVTRYPAHQVFVESGTADGETVVGVADLFARVHTIEIVPSVYVGTQKKMKLEHPGVKNVEYWLGDSTEILPRILERVDVPCFFWLDGHYCGSTEARGKLDTPVVQELETIMADKHPHVIFIDDARLFGRDPAYPTIDWVRNLVTNQNIEYTFAYEDDMIRILPKGQ